MLMNLLSGNGRLVVGLNPNLFENLTTERVSIEEPGFVIVYVDNQTIGKDVWFDNVQVLHYNTKVMEENHYYPFGLTISNKSMANNVQPLKYNGKELETTFDLQTYEYGARQYNSQIGRWNGVDPLSDKYYPISPFAYVANNPVNAIDPDGKKILFVNGFYSSAIGWAVGSSKGGEKYWGKGFATAAQSFFNDYSEVTSNNYISGSSTMGGDMSGSDRFKAGYEYAETNLSFLLVGMKEGEAFNMVTHSEGAAYGAGMARYLIDKGFNVETIAHLSPDEGDEFVTPKEPMTYYLSYRNDWVTSNYLIKGTDITGIVERSDLGFSTVHGSTKSAYVFKELSDLKTLNVQQIGTWGRYHVPVYKQFKSSTPNGTSFHSIEDNTKKIKFGHIHKTE